MYANIVIDTRRSYETTSFEREQSIAYIYILKTFPTLHFNFLKIIIIVCVCGN